MRKIICAALMALAIFGCSAPRQGPFIPSIFESFDLEPGPNVQFDAAGIPSVKIWSTNAFNQSATTIAQWGLGAMTRYSKSHNPTELAKARKAADWLLAHQSQNGGFPLMFDHHHPDPRGFQLKAPWYSAITQGNAMSLLVRMYGETGDTRYLDSAERALLLLEIPVASGGLQGELNGMPWFEETPDPAKPSHIFNGSIFALLGIGDLYAATGNRMAGMLWGAGEESLRKNLRFYVIATTPEDATLPHPWSVYELQHNGFPEKPHYLTDFYMGVHIKLMREMAMRTGQMEYSMIADQWEKSLGEYLRTHNKSP